MELGLYGSGGLLFSLLLLLFNAARADEVPVPIHSDQEQFEHTYGGPFSNNIPFRPVRRIGSEFLGKRAHSPPLESLVSAQDNSLEPEFGIGKRARTYKMGSEFLGKRRLGSEFLGKRFVIRDLDSSPDDEDNYYDYDRFMEKRALGSEFLGKRRLPSPYMDWSWKRARLGSEFLGKRKRSLGSEFLG